MRRRHTTTINAICSMLVWRWLGGAHPLARYPWIVRGASSGCVDTQAAYVDEIKALYSTSYLLCMLHSSCDTALLSPTRRARPSTSPYLEVYLLPSISLDCFEPFEYLNASINGEPIVLNAITHLPRSTSNNGYYEKSRHHHRRRRNWSHFCLLLGRSWIRCYCDCRACAW